MDWDQCPYDKSHLVKPTRFSKHLIKCRKQHPDSDLRRCCFNVTHLVRPEDFKRHIEEECSDARNSDHFLKALHFARENQDKIKMQVSRMRDEDEGAAAVVCDGSEPVVINEWPILLPPGYEELQRTEEVKLQDQSLESPTALENEVSEITSMMSELTVDIDDSVSNIGRPLTTAEIRAQQWPPQLRTAADFQRKYPGKKPYVKVKVESYPTVTKQLANQWFTPNRGENNPSRSSPKTPLVSESVVSVPLEPSSDAGSVVSQSGVRRLMRKMAGLEAPRNYSQNYVSGSSPKTPLVSESVVSVPLEPSSDAGSVVSQSGVRRLMRKMAGLEAPRNYSQNYVSGSSPKTPLVSESVVSVPLEPSSDAGSVVSQSGVRRLMRKMAGLEAPRNYSQNYVSGSSPKTPLVSESVVSVPLEPSSDAGSVVSQSAVSRLTREIVGLESSPNHSQNYISGSSPKTPLVSESVVSVPLGPSPAVRRLMRKMAGPESSPNHSQNYISGSSPKTPLVSESVVSVPLGPSSGVESMVSQLAVRRLLMRKMAGLNPSTNRDQSISNDYLNTEKGNSPKVTKASESVVSVPHGPSSNVNWDLTRGDREDLESLASSASNDESIYYDPESEISPKGIKDSDSVRSVPLCASSDVDEMEESCLPWSVSEPRSKWIKMESKACQTE